MRTTNSINVTVIITTYNWPEALKMVLVSMIGQSKLPDEVIVADDGSRDSTRLLIQNYQKDFPCPLIHCWQEDLGFRPGHIRNKAIALATGDYIIVIDGDMILKPQFVEDHIYNARKKMVIAGKRMKMSKRLSQQVLNNKTSPSFFSLGFLSERSILLQWRWLSKIRSTRENNSNKVISANFSFWREDAIKVNGFNEDFLGWGPEDKEFCLRLIHSGCQKLKLRNAANAYHLYHNDNEMSMIPKNNAIYNNTLKNKLSWCENGIDKHLKISKLLSD